MPSDASHDDWRDDYALSQRLSRSRRRGALYHEEALAAEERFHLELLPYPKRSLLTLPINCAELLDRRLRKLYATAKIVCIEYLLHRGH